MAYHTKKYYSDRVILGLQDNYPNQDFKIDEREVWPVLDDLVNALAAQDYFANWKMSGTSMDEGFITTWDEVTVTDFDNNVPSELTLPSNYAALPNNAGIDEIWPLKWVTDNRDYSVVIMSHSDFRRYRQMPAGQLEGRLGGYPKGNKFIFTQCGVKKKYGNMGVRLVVRSSADIGVTDPYPIPSNWEGKVIQDAIAYFVNKRMQPTDQVRDKKDQA